MRGRENVVRVRSFNPRTRNRMALAAFRTESPHPQHLNKGGLSANIRNIIKQVEGIFTMDASRPLDALNDARNKRVIVELKNNKQLIGNLKAFDIHINIVLSDAEERSSSGELTRKLGTVFIRGDTITVISPA